MPEVDTLVASRRLEGHRLQAGAKKGSQVGRVALRDGDGDI